MVTRYLAEVQATKERNDPARRIKEIMETGHLWAEPDQTLVSEEQAYANAQK
jgi:hypothetical protein